MKLLLALLFLAVPLRAQVIRQNGINESNSSITISTLVVTNSLSVSTLSVSGYFQVAGGTLSVSNSGIITAKSQPCVQAAVNASGDVLANNVQGQIFFQAPVYDTQNMWGGVTSSGAFTIPAGGTGFYNVAMQNSLQSASAQQYWINVNGGNTYMKQWNPDANTEMQTIQRVAKLNAGDVLTFFILQNSGSNKTTLSTSILTGYAEICKLW